jgi:hypothetical protein
MYWNFVAIDGVIKNQLFDFLLIFALLCSNFLQANLFVNTTKESHYFSKVYYNRITYLSWQDLFHGKMIGTRIHPTSGRRLSDLLLDYSLTCWFKGAHSSLVNSEKDKEQRETGIQAIVQLISIPEVSLRHTLAPVRWIWSRLLVPALVQIARYDGRSWGVCLELVSICNPLVLPENIYTIILRNRSY